MSDFVILGITERFVYLVINNINEKSMTEQLKPGDVVQLKSGGQTMTIEDIENIDTEKAYAICIWFEKSECKSKNIFLSALKKYKEPKDGGFFFGSV